MSAINEQVGGTHYKEMQYQPIKLIQKTGVDFFCGNVIKYVSRYKKKNGIEDLRKAKHYLEYMKENNVRQRVYPDWVEELDHYGWVNRMDKLEVCIISYAIKGYYNLALESIDILINDEGGDNE
ncbi:MAG: DUF3310 domain-containing protein [Bacteroidales bacterium]|nr:DUF3310 domain-containing protein [Candidatus Colimorpha merdihippi]